jgi:hypothetical protein
MAADMLDLRPAPEEISVTDGLRQLHARLDKLLAPAAAGVPQTELAASGPDAGTLLRHRLAVRGWVSPRNLMAGFSEDEAETALRTVGQEVEVAEQMRAGQWFMTLAARKRVFASTDPALLGQASKVLHPDDERDPLRLALRLAMDIGPDASSAAPNALLERLKDQPAEVLRELSRMAAWGSAIPGLDALAAAAGAKQNRRERVSERETAGATVIFGRWSEQQQIRQFLSEPPNPQLVRTLYVSGIGGSGKSTMLLAAEDELYKDARAIVVRLDFDSAYLDPRSPEQMDVMFLRALAVEEPALAPALQRTIAQLHSLAEQRVRARIEAQGEVQEHDRIAPGRYGVLLKRAKYATGSGSGAESAGISEGYERLSALHALASMRELERGVVLFLDTMENVSRVGADAIDSVLGWLGSIGDCLPVPFLRAVLAGRDALGQPDMQAMARRFQAHGLELVTEVNLADLEEADAREMLIHGGIPADYASIAAAVLPRNPLVLRLAADAFRAAKDDLSTIQQDYRAGRIDRQTASGYLAQRVVQHVPRQPARRYAVAALALETVTERQLRDIVIPAVDGVKVADRKLARKVYDGLQRASWLTLEDGLGTLRWHTELRRLALPMIEADPEFKEVNRRVHSAAAVWCERRQSPGERALADFHRAEAVKATVPQRLPDFAARKLSRPAAALPDNTATGLQAAFDEEVRGADDHLHRLKLEGVGSSPGEGDRLVAQGRGALALESYRERPTRAPGVPPTFVIRALAQTGDWDTHYDVDTGMVLAELRKHFGARSGRMQGPMVERLHWLTRLEMLRTGALGRMHVELLRDACRGLKFKPQAGALFGLVGMAEALYSLEQGPLLIAPASWPPPMSDVGPELRFSIARTILGQFQSPERTPRWISSNLAAMLLLNEGWPGDLLMLSRQESLQVEGRESFLLDLGRQIVQLRSVPLVDVEQFISSCRDVRVRIDLSRIEPAVAARILRGTFVEFHSPLAALLSADSLKLSLDRLLLFVHQLPLPPGAVLALAEFESAGRRAVHRRNLQGAVSAVIVALDRAQALAAFCAALVRDPPALLDINHRATLEPLLDLSARYLTWDRAFQPDVN